MASRRRSEAREAQEEGGPSVPRTEPAERPPRRRPPPRPEHLAGNPRIWSVGGGKGGVGKSVVASSLAVAIAGKGRRCALIDADLGGANLHTLLGAARPKRTLSHLLSGEAATLAELMVPTSVPNLWLVSGDQALLEIANPKHHQKEKLFRHIRGLDVDEVVLDLGAGSAFNVLDFFVLAKRKLVVVSPEPTAIENAEHFVRAALHRTLRAVARDPEVRAAILRARTDRRSARVRSAGELIALVRELDPPAAKRLQECAQTFLPTLLVNQVRSEEHRVLGRQLVASCRERLGVPIVFAGFFDADENVKAAVARRQPVLQAFPHCDFARSIETLAERMLRDDWDAPREARSVGRNEERIGAAPARLPPLDLAAPGAYLRRCREALGVSLREMIERTRIRILEHIEAERFEQLPPEPYLKGYLLSYAQELGIAEFGRLVASYLARLPR